MHNPLLGTIRYKCLCIQYIHVFRVQQYAVSSIPHPSASPSPLSIACTDGEGNSCLPGVPYSPLATPTVRRGHAVAAKGGVRYRSSGAHRTTCTVSCISPKPLLFQRREARGEFFIVFCLPHPSIPLFDATAWPPGRRERDFGTVLPLPATERPAFLCIFHCGGRAPVLSCIKP